MGRSTRELTTPTLLPRHSDASARSLGAFLQSKTSKTAILICIDASSRMQKPTRADDDDDDPEEGRSFFHGALESVFELEKRKALLAPSDLVGILIYNTVSLTIIIFSITCARAVASAGREAHRAWSPPCSLRVSLFDRQAKLPEHESEEATGMYTLAKLSTVSIDQVKDLKELIDGAHHLALYNSACVLITPT